MKVVIDTNIFISGVFFSGAPYQVLQAWRDQKIQVVISQEIIAEYRRVGEIFAQERPGVDLSKMLDYLFQNAVIYEAPALPEPVCTDPDDDKFFACALASGSQLIVSGDKHLLKASGYHAVEVLKPNEFLDKFLD
ncbi:MAG: putative toxin-antitoxin system toxin component, PIN family [Anaerolinea sp.]|nr:putative toxin-antitoxin system toxin component, PIN family [Anaerolinea sp.]